MRRPSLVYAGAVLLLSSASCAGGSQRPAHTASVEWEPPDSWDDTKSLPATPDAKGSEARADSPPPLPEESPLAPSTVRFAPPAPTGTTTVSVTRRPMPVGSKLDATVTLTSRALFGVENPNGTMTVEDVRSFVEHRRVEILEVDPAGEARKIRVSYEEKKEARINNGRERRKTSPVAGKSYLVEWGDERPTVTDPSGAAAPTNEATIVEGSFRDLGNPTAFAQAIPQGSLGVGTPIPALAEALKAETRRAFEDRSFFGKVSVVPQGTRDANGTTGVVFAVTLQVGFVQEDGKIRMDLHGVLVVKGDSAWPLMLDVSGPVAVDSTVNGAPVHGRGTARLTVAHAYP